MALGRSDAKMVELLCSFGSSRSVDLLAYYGDVQTAAAVFAANPALANDPEALENAAGQGHEPFVQLMLRYQPDLAARIAVGVRANGPLEPAKSRELTELLFARDERKQAKLVGHHAAPSVRPEVRRRECKALYRPQRADLHARDEDLRSTPLGWAAKFGKLPMVELLLERGAKPNLADDPPWATPLAWAGRRGHDQIAELLKQHGTL